MGSIEKRDGFATKWGFILACIGSAVGMGNIWRFPVLVSEWGGMTFLIPYFIFVIFIGLKYSAISLSKFKSKPVSLSVPSRLLTILSVAG